MEEYVLLLDIGGTEIKVNGIKEDNQFLLKKTKHYPSLASESEEVIISHLVEIIEEMTEEFSERLKLKAIGFSIPGPFNYRDGISLMTGLRKYESLYKVNIKNKLQEKLNQIKLSNVPLIFENDGTCFALGEYLQHNVKSKGIYLTLGTGCGSTFIEHGEIIIEGFGLNKIGMIYDTPFLDKTIDDYLSVAGLKKLAEERQIIFSDGLSMFKEAELGNEGATKVFDDFGKLISEALSSFIIEFKPDEVVFGGQISKSFHYFRQPLEQNLLFKEIKFRSSKDTASATFYGLNQVIKKELGEK
ncbi:ROK family protein [uncultured Vagococcus sp.]|uniref:ROK family protein n=1 Tax=uncultured Vagococcus sp. TaxID=189676 RepID=UPI00258ABC30|nr:ROK family protein [uncultured Vagococcus sp.]